MFDSTIEVHVLCVGSDVSTLKYYLYSNDEVCTRLVVGDLRRSR